MLPKVVITGRPNVGKSTLFNRLVGQRLALVADTPGVTRDRKEAEATLAGTKVLLVDTAGLEESAPDSLPGRMRASTSILVVACMYCWISRTIGQVSRRVLMPGLPWPTQTMFLRPGTPER